MFCCFGCLVFSFLHSLILMFMTVKAQTTRETKLLYCSIFRFSISTHGPNSLSNLCRSSFTHLSRPCACTVAARGLLSNNAISPKKKIRTKKMKIGIVFTHQFTCTELHMYRTSHVPNFTCTELYMYRTSHVPNFTCTELYMYRTLHVPNFTCT